MRNFLYFLLAFTALVLGVQRAGAFLFSANSANGIPLSVAFNPAPTAAPVPIQPYVLDTATNGTQVAQVLPQMSSGPFTGSLAFNSYSGADLVIDGTQTNVASSASHNFVNWVNAKDGALACNDIVTGTNHWSINSASHTFVQSDVGYGIYMYGPPNTTTTGDTTNGSPTIVNIPSTANMSPGQVVTGTNAPNATITIVSVDSASQITVSGTALSTRSTFTITDSTRGIAKTGNTTKGSNVITGMSSTSGMFAGDTVSASNFGNFILSVDSPTQITMTKNATGTTVGGTLTTKVNWGTNSAWGTIYLDTDNPGSLELQHEGSNGLCPGPDGAQNVWWYILYSTDRHNILHISGGSGCTPGDYEIMDYTPTGQAVFDRSLGTAGSTCTWSMTMDGGGHYALSNQNVVTKSSSTNLLPLGNRVGTVEVNATQNGTTAKGVLPITILTNSPEPYAIGEDNGDIPGQPPDCGNIYVPCDAYSTNGYALNLTAQSGDGTTDAPITGNSQWNSIGGDWWGCTGSVGTAPCTVQGNKLIPGFEYANFSSANGGAVDQAWTFSGSGAVQWFNDVMSPDSGGDALSAIFTMTQPRTVYTCYGNTNSVANRPSMTVTYNDSTTETLPCLSLSILGNTDNPNVISRLNQTLSGGATTQIAVTFKHPSKSISATSVSVGITSSHQFTGLTTVKMYRVRTPRGTPDGTGYAQNFVLDQNIATATHTWFYFPLDVNDRNNNYVEPGNVNFDWTCNDNTKYPLSNYGKIVNGETGNNLNGIINYTERPTAVTAGYTQFGYFPLAAGSPEAWVINNVLGQEVIQNWRLWFQPTATGAQGPGTTCLVNGSDNHISAGTVLPAGKLPTHASLRYMILLLADFQTPEYLSLPGGGNGGKFMTGFAAGRDGICGNGGNPCGSSNSFGASYNGTIGWTNRMQWITQRNPALLDYSKLLIGSYIYNVNLFQSDRTGVIPLSPLTWHSVELEWKLNTFSNTGNSTLTAANVVTGGVACPSGNYPIIGGTGTAAHLVVTSSGNTATSATIDGANPGNYTVGPAPNPVSVSGGCDATFNIRSTDESLADGFSKVWIDDILTVDSEKHTWNHTPPWGYVTGGVATGQPYLPANGGAHSVWFNTYCGGTSGCPVNPMHFAISHLVISDGTHIGPVRLQ